MPTVIGLHRRARPQTIARPAATCSRRSSSQPTSLQGNNGKVLDQNPSRRRCCADRRRSVVLTVGEYTPPPPTPPPTHRAPRPRPDRDRAAVTATTTAATPRARALVHGERPPRPPVARDARPLARARVGGDAAPDAGATRRAGVRRVRRAVPHPGGDRRRGTGRVIAAWGRLGYPRRARWLWEAARRIDADGWPDDLRELPGVGRYTAAAVAAQADDADAIGIEVNIRRVCERVRGARLSTSRGRSTRPSRSRRRCAGATGCSRSWISARRCAPRARRRCDALPDRARLRDARRAPRRDAAPPGGVRGIVPRAARQGARAAARRGRRARSSSTAKRSRRSSTTGSRKSRAAARTSRARRRVSARRPRGSCAGGRDPRR